MLLSPLLALQFDLSGPCIAVLLASLLISPVLVVTAVVAIVAWALYEGYRGVQELRGRR